jgi:hypothetical protein
VPEGLIDLARLRAAAVGHPLDHRQQLAGLLHEARVLQLGLVVALHRCRALRAAPGRAGRASGR